jgi:hypothetical protein
MNESTADREDRPDAAASEHVTEVTEPVFIRHEARVNQHQHEPTPASHDAGPGQTAADPHAPRGPRPAAQGDAVRDMMGGPPPQGDVPDAPATQIAATNEDNGSEDNGQGVRVRHVANAVPGQPDGEVDTRS